MANENNHLKLLYLYQILLRYSDMEHPLSTNELVEMIEECYHVTIYRTTVYHYIEELNAGGIEIMEVCGRNKQYYLSDRPFELAELRLLVDAVESSRSIPLEKSRELIRKLLSLVSEPGAEKLKQDLAGRVKTLNQKILYIIDKINEAINNGRRISFQYGDYDGDKNKILRNGGRPYILSPYSLIWNNDYYYVIGYNHAKEHIATFRLDRIPNVPTIRAEAADPPPADFDISAYFSGVFQMYDTEEQVEVTLLCENDLMKHVIDRFGLEVDTHRVDDGHFEAHVSVCASPNFYRWVFGWCGSMIITGPQEVVDEFREMVRKVMKTIEQ